MKTYISLSIFILAAFSLCAYFYCPLIPFREPTTANHISECGLHIIEFETPYGKIYVNLPDDMAMGDIISGTLSAEPAGKKEKDRDKNMDLLKGYIIDINNQKTAVAEEWGTWTIPDTDELSIILRDQQGNVAAKTEVPVIDEAPSLQSEEFTCPIYAQAGRPFIFGGKFNGDFSDTQVRMNEKEVDKLAESSRQAVVLSPMDQIGTTTVDLDEGDSNAEFECRNILVEPSIGKSKLKKGETTELVVIIRGLEGLENDIPLQIENKTPNLVKMDESGLISIQPNDVEEGGIYTFKTLVTGIMPGNFHIQASIVLLCEKPEVDF
jgi:hypothetical protein